MSLQFIQATVTPWNQMYALLAPAYVQTLKMVAIVVGSVIVLGIPLALVLHNSGPGGLFPRRHLHAVLGWIVNLGRSLPFLILMAAILPFTNLLTGTTIGTPAAIVPMIIAGTPFFARLVENSLREVPPAVTDVARASGGSNFQIMSKAQFSEAWPGMIGSIAILSIGMIDYSAIAGTVGAGGIGYVAVTYGYDQFDNNVMLATIVVLVITVALIQLTGDFFAWRVSRR
jgi:D-methionine transport system permease protein